MNTYFITGTGTDVGKTFLTCLLIRRLQRKGRAVQAFKPVISGFEPEDDTSDTVRLLHALGRLVTPASVDGISPWRYVAPLTPSVAAAREGRVVSFEALVDFCDLQMSEETLTLVEGVGGLMAPLDEHHTVLDWMAALDWPVLLVAGSYLGALSHTLTATEALQNRGLKLGALIVSESADPPMTLEETCAVLARFCDPEVPIVPLPRLAGTEDLWKGAAMLDALFD